MSGAFTVLTSNKSFGWGKIFGDESPGRGADRPASTHHCHIITIRRNSYRTHQHSERWRAPRPAF